MSSAPTITGYLDRLTYRAGDPVTLFAAGQNQRAEVRLVRLGRSPVPGRTARAAVEDIAWDGAGPVEVSTQSSCVGSFATTTLIPRLTSRQGLTLGVCIWTTVADWDDPQTILDLTGGGGALRLELVDSHIVLVVGEDRLVSESPVGNRSWTSVRVNLSTGHASLQLIAHDELYGASSRVKTALSSDFESEAPTLTLAAQAARDVVHCDGYARGRAEHHFTGKIADPFVLYGTQSRDLRSVSEIRGAVTTIGGAAWSLSPVDSGPTRFLCRTYAGKADPMVLVNLPNQGVTGPSWDGTAVSFREKPDHYAAAHFHSTDLVDAGWAQTMTAALPESLRSGVYGIELTGADGTQDTIPLFVPAKPGARTAKVCFMLPTFSYLAYANEDLVSHFANAVGHRFRDPEVLKEAQSRQVYHGREFGRSLYDRHIDGSGVHYSSALRPILDMRAEYGFWSYPEGSGRAFSGDMYLVEWLETFGYDFDVVTEEQLHVEGSAALDGYDVVLTGSHPEYPSTEILDAIESYRAAGGSLFYLGGNGYYWVTGVVNAHAPIVETRRGNAGVRSWDSPPGETDLVSSWEPGGLWRHRGRAPQKLFGVGMAAAGGMSRPYRMSTDESVRREFAWFYDGLEGDLIGDQGFVRGGASGDEIDRVDFALGTPPGTVVLASSWGHDEGAQRATEEVLQPYHGSTSGPNDPEIHADMIYFETPAGGAVFATGSIAYFGALLVDGGDNNASRALRNVLDHVMGD